MMAHYPTPRRFSSIQLALALALGLGLVIPSGWLPAAQAAPAVYAPLAAINVTTTADEYGSGAGCSLREAIQAANTNAAYGGCTAGSAGLDTINLPAGTYTLTRAGLDNTNANGDLDVTEAISIQGADQATTIVQAGTDATNGVDKIFSFNPFTDTGVLPGFAITLQNLTLRNGRNAASSSVWEQEANSYGGAFDFDAGTNGLGSLTLSNVTIENNSTSNGWGGGMALFGGGTVSITNSTIRNNVSYAPEPGYGVGGGILIGNNETATTGSISLSNVTLTGNRAINSGTHIYSKDGNGGGIAITSFANPVNVSIVGGSISNNEAFSDGGGLYALAQRFAISGGTVISGNTAGRDGGGIYMNSDAATTSSVVKARITGNSAGSRDASGKGGAIRAGDLAANLLSVSYSDLSGNTAPQYPGLYIAGGTANVMNNWWGCSSDPSLAPCSKAGKGGSATLNIAPYARLLVTAASTSLITNQQTGLTASFTTNSSGTNVWTDMSPLLSGKTVSWSSVGGSLALATGTISSSGTITNTYTASAANASNSATAVVDADPATAGSNRVALTVTAANTITSITGAAPSTGVAGEPVTISFSVTGASGNTPTAPAGSVTVTASSGESCSGTLPATSCNLIFRTGGSKTLSASFTRTGVNFNSSSTTGPFPLNVVVENTYVDDNNLCGGSFPCYTTLATGQAAAAAGKQVTVYPGVYTETVTLNRAVTVTLTSGSINLVGDLSVSAGLWNSGPANLFVNGEFSQTGGVWQGGSGVMSLTGDFTFAGGTFTPQSGKVIFGGPYGILTAVEPLAFHDLEVAAGAELEELPLAPVTVAGTLTNKGLIRMTREALADGEWLSFGLTEAAIYVDQRFDLSSLTVARVDAHIPESKGLPEDGMQTGRYWTLTRQLQEKPLGEPLSEPVLDIQLPFSAAGDGSRVCRYTTVIERGAGFDCGLAADNTSLAGRVTRRSVTTGGWADEPNLLANWAVGDNTGPTRVGLAAYAERPARVAPGVLVALGVLVVGAVWRWRKRIFRIPYFVFRRS